MAIFNTPARTHVRDTNGPRAVDSGNTGSRNHRSSGRRYSKGEDNEKHRPRRRESHKSSSKKDGHRRKLSSTSTSQQQQQPTATAQPTLELTIVSPPPHGIALGQPLSTSVVLSLRNGPISPSQIDTTRLFALSTLLDSSTQAPLEASILTGPKPYASLAALPAESARTFERIHPDLTPLGYFSFAGLVIRQAGSFVVRTTLARMGDGGAVSVCVVDSEGVRVEGRGGGVGERRRAQRVYD